MKLNFVCIFYLKDFKLYISHKYIDKNSIMDSFYSLLKMKKYIKRIKKSNEVATLLGIKTIIKKTKQKLS